MPYWAEVVQGFRDPSREKDAKDQQPIAILALMYLTLGKDYPYNMSKNFKFAFKNKIKGSSILTTDKVGDLLETMAEKGLLVAEPDLEVRARPRDFYKINPAILQFPLRDESIPLIPPHIIDEFLEWLEKSYSSDDKRKEFIKLWSSIDDFDFLTFLMFLKRQASKWEKILDEEMSKGEKLSQKIVEYIDILKKSGTVTPRIIDFILDFEFNREFPGNFKTKRDPREPW